jgi:hypothetical protein
MEKRNSIENSSLFERKCRAEAITTDSALSKNQRPVFVSGKFISRPSQVKTRKKSGAVLFIRKLFPF